MKKSDRRRRPNLDQINAAALAAALPRWQQVSDLYACGLTYEEIGLRLGVTKSRAWQLHRRWLRYQAAHPTPTPAMVH